MPENVKCADCGFLAVRFRQTRQLLDAESFLRERGYLLETDPVTGGTAYEPHPVCFVRQLSFREAAGLTPTESTLKATVQEMRDCDGFTEWKQGFTPKEHYEMTQEAARLEWQAKRESDDKAERSVRDREARDFQSDQADKARRHQNRTLTVSVVAVAVAILALVANTTLGLLKKPQPIIVQSPAAATTQQPPTTAKSAAPSLPQTSPPVTKAE